MIDIASSVNIVLWVEDYRFKDFYSFLSKSPKNFRFCRSYQKQATWIKANILSPKLMTELKWIRTSKNNVSTRLNNIFFFHLVTLRLHRRHIFYFSI